MTRRVGQLVGEQSSALRRSRVEAAWSKDDVPAHCVGVRGHRLRGRTGAFVGVDAYIREIVAGPCFYVASRLGRYRPALSSEHLMHDCRGDRRSRSGRAAVELVVVVGTAINVGFGSQRLSVALNRGRLLIFFLARRALAMESLRCICGSDSRIRHMHDLVGDAISFGFERIVHRADLEFALQVRRGARQAAQHCLIAEMWLCRVRAPYVTDERLSQTRNQVCRSRWSQLRSRLLHSEFPRNNQADQKGM